MFKLFSKSPKNLPLLALIAFTGAGLGAAFDHLFSTPKIVPASAPSAPSFDMTANERTATRAYPDNRELAARNEEVAAPASAGTTSVNPLAVGWTPTTRPAAQPASAMHTNSTSRNSVTSPSLAPAPISNSSARSVGTGNTKAAGGPVFSTSAAGVSGNRGVFENSAPMQVSPSVAKAIQGAPVAVLPAVMAEVPPDWVLDATHVAIQDQMADDFVAAVGGENQDPTNPAYKARWQNAQWQADQRYRALYGAQAFAAMQKQAYLQSISGARGQQ